MRFEVYVYHIADGTVVHVHCTLNMFVVVGVTLLLPVIWFGFSEWIKVCETKSHLCVSKTYAATYCSHNIVKRKKRSPFSHTTRTQHVDCRRQIMLHVFVVCVE